MQEETNTERERERKWVMQREACVRQRERERARASERAREGQHSGRHSSHTEIHKSKLCERGMIRQIKIYQASQFNKYNGNISGLY